MYKYQRFKYFSIGLLRRNLFEKTLNLRVQEIRFFLGNYFLCIKPIQEEIGNFFLIQVQSVVLPIAVLNDGKGGGYCQIPIHCFFLYCFFHACTFKLKQRGYLYYLISQLDHAFFLALPKRQNKKKDLFPGCQLKDIYGKTIAHDSKLFI